MASDLPVDGAGILRSSVEETPLNEEIPERYLAVREFARGGMGRILIVRDRHLGRDIALKELLPSAPLDAPTVEGGPTTEHAQARLVRFVQEASITARLEHPSIVPVHEVGRRSNGTPYYTMKLVRGRTLDRAIAEAGSLTKRLELLHHFLDLCQALAYAHSRGVIHRDIKPTNVMIGEFGETLLLDWGIAKAGRRTEIEAVFLCQGCGHKAAEGTHPHDPVPVVLSEVAPFQNGLDPVHHFAHGTRAEFISGPVFREGCSGR